MRRYFNTSSLVPRLLYERQPHMWQEHVDHACLTLARVDLPAPIRPEMPMNTFSMRAEAKS